MMERHVFRLPSSLKYLSNELALYPDIRPTDIEDIMVGLCKANLKLEVSDEFEFLELDVIDRKIYLDSVMDIVVPYCCKMQLESTTNEWQQSTDGDSDRYLRLLDYVFHLDCFTTLYTFVDYIVGHSNKRVIRVHIHKRKVVVIYE